MAKTSINGLEVLASGVVLLDLGSELRVETRLGPVTIHSAHRHGGVGVDGEGGFIAHLASGETFKDSSAGSPEGIIRFLRRVETFQDASIVRLTYTIILQTA